MDWLPLHPLKRFVTQAKSLSISTATANRRGKLLYTRERGGHALITMIGITVMTMTSGVLAIDLPSYFVAQNQLQTAVNAAAIAGAYQLPLGETEAEDAAYDIAGQNPVAGQNLGEGNLQFDYGDNPDTMTMVVKGRTPVPTIVGKMLCSLRGGTNKQQADWQAEVESGGLWNDDGATEETSSCNPMIVAASAKAVPAARDTILVIDTSSSMVDGVQPIKAVKTAATKFVNIIDGFNNASVDRIALVDFNRFGFKKIGLTSKSDSNGTGFTKVKDAITNLKTYSSTTPGYVGGWNTNYYIGLKTALDEIEAKGRQNAKKNIVFLTDGKPNLPAPPEYYQQYGSSEYRKCSEPVENSTAVKNLNYTKTVSGKKRYYTWSLPYTLCYKINNTGTSYCDSNLTYSEHAIKNSHVAAVKSDICGQKYIDYMTTMVEEQIARAKHLGVTIHTIEIYDSNLDNDNAGDMLRRISTDLAWDPQLVEKIAEQTNGETYSAATTDTSGIALIYELIAKDVKVKLAY